MFVSRCDKCPIIFGILEAAKDNLPITKIMYSTNLNYKEIKRCSTETFKQIYMFKHKNIRLANSVPSADGDAPK